MTSAESVLGITWGLDRVLGDPGPRRSTGLRCSAHRLAPDDAVSGELLGVEHVFSWMWDNYAGLSDHCAAAQGPAEHPWPRLCEAGRLARNEVPVAETVCVDDMDVDRSLAEHTALRVRGLRPCITNEYAHNGPRVDGERTVGRLLDRLPGRT